MNGRTSLPAPIFLGTSPAGVEYVARFEQDVEPMKRALAHHWARHNAKNAPVRRVTLTAGQADRLDAVLSGESVATFEGEGVTFRRSYVQGPHDALCDLAGWIDPEGAADDAGAASDAQHDHEVVFAERSAYAAAVVLRSKLVGKPVSMKVARKAAMRARF